MIRLFAIYKLSSMRRYGDKRKYSQIMGEEGKRERWTGEREIEDGDGGKRQVFYNPKPHTL